MTDLIFKQYPLQTEDFDLKEIELTRKEKNELNGLSSKIKRLNNIKSNQLTHYWTELKNNDELTRNAFNEEQIKPIISELKICNSEKEQLLIQALNRHFELTFKNDPVRIFEDVKNKVDSLILDKEKLDDVVSLLKPVFNNDYKIIFKYYVGTLYYETSRMHWNYCLLHNLEGLRKEISEYIMQEAKKQFKKDYGLDENCDFTTIRWNKYLADLRKPHTRLLNPLTVEDDVVIYELENTTLKFEHFKNLDSFGKKMLIFLLYIYTIYGINNKRILTFKVSEYMQLCDLKSLNNAVDQIRKGLENLYSLSVLIHKPKNTQDTSKERRIIADKDSDIKNDYAMVEITNQFLELTKDNRFIKLSKLFFRINLLHFPNSPDILLKLSEQKSMNFKSKNDDIIRVATLLEACPNIPKYSEIKEKGRINQRIKDPFFRDLNKLSEVLNYELYTVEKESISIDEAKMLPFEEFENIRIHIKWIDYPERKNTLQKSS